MECGTSFGMPSARPASGSLPWILPASSRVRSPSRSSASAMTERPWEPGEALRAMAELDLERTARRGYPEAIYCEGKTAEQVAAIADEIRHHDARTLFTRASPDHAKAVLAAL